MSHSSRTFLDELNEAAEELTFPGKRKAAMASNVAISLREMSLRRRSHN